MMYDPCQISQGTPSQGTPFDDMDLIESRFPDRGIYLREEKIQCPSRDNCFRTIFAVTDKADRERVCYQKVQVTTNLQTGEKSIREDRDGIICRTWSQFRGDPEALPTELPQNRNPRNIRYFPPRWPADFSK